MHWMGRWGDSETLHVGNAGEDEDVDDILKFFLECLTSAHPCLLLAYTWVLELFSSIALLLHPYIIHVILTSLFFIVISISYFNLS